MLPGKVVDLIQHQLERFGGSEPANTVQILAHADITTSSHLLVVILILLLWQVVPSKSPAQQTMSNDVK